MEENVLNQGAQQVDNSAKERQKNKTKKVIATTTYFIAMLCLLAGLFVPLFNCADGVKLPERMMFRYLPSMFNGIFGKEIIKLSEGGYFLGYIGYAEDEFSFMSLIGVLYAIVCVIALVMFVPILLGRKKNNTSARCALGVEVLAMLVTLTYIAYTTFFLVNLEVLAWTDYNFLLAFGGSLLMAIIQTVSSKGSIGVSKVIALILSVIGVIAILDITLFIPKLADPLNKLSEKIKGGSIATFLDTGLSGDAVEGAEVTKTLGITGINYLISIKQTFAMFGELAKGGKEGIITLVILLLLILVALFTVINLVCDVIGISTGKKYKKDRSPCKNGASNTFALVRYCLTIVFAAALIIMLFAIEDLGMHPGVYLWLLVIVLFISLINAAVRTAVDNSRYKKGAVAPSDEAQQKIVLSDPAFAAQQAAPAAEPAPESLPVYASDTYNTETPAATPEALPVYNAPEEYTTTTLPPYNPEAQTAQPDVAPDYMSESYAAEPEYAEPAPVVEPLSAPLEEPEENEVTRTVYIYGGATDEFMDTLTDNEKVEFVELFLKKSKGTVNGVPDYVIDGDNSDFFPAVFVHINRYRNIVSDALMTKMYKQLGKQM